MAPLSPVQWNSCPKPYQSCGFVYWSIESSCLTIVRVVPCLSPNSAREVYPRMNLVRVIALRLKMGVAPENKIDADNRMFPASLDNEKSG